jgi:hypothetical protein
MEYSAQVLFLSVKFLIMSHRWRQAKSCSYYKFYIFITHIIGSGEFR